MLQSVSKPIIVDAKRKLDHRYYTKNPGNDMELYIGGVYRLYAPEMLKGAIKRYIEEYSEELVKMSVVNEVYELLTTDLNYIPLDALNTQENVINFENGLLDLSGGAPVLIPHSPDVYSPMQIPCRWTGKAAPTPMFDGYMRTLTGGDEAVTKLLSEFTGMCLSNVLGYRMKKSLFLVGPGNSGKSQLKASCEKLLGRGNYTGIDLREIEAHFGGDAGAWVYDRIMIVHCDNVIEAGKQDKLLEKMYAEREGIVYKCIGALMYVIRNGLCYSEPPCVLNARNTHMEDNSTVITFFHECMVSRKHKDNCTVSVSKTRELSMLCSLS